MRALMAIILLLMKNNIDTSARGVKACQPVVDRRPCGVGFPPDGNDCHCIHGIGAVRRRVGAQPVVGSCGAFSASRYRRLQACTKLWPVSYGQRPGDKVGEGLDHLDGAVAKAGGVTHAGSPDEVAFPSREGQLIHPGSPLPAATSAESAHRDWSVTR